MTALRGEALRPTSGSPRQATASCVRTLLDPQDWRVWASLPLSRLCEAAPDEFLSAVERGLRGESPVLAALFGEEAEDGLFGSSPHVELLFALEILCWSEEFFARSAMALATLARLDPGGRLANRPLASLVDVFLPWSPPSAASSGENLMVPTSPPETMAAQHCANIVFPTTD